MRPTSQPNIALVGFSKYSQAAAKQRLLPQMRQCTWERKGMHVGTRGAPTCEDVASLSAPKHLPNKSHLRHPRRDLRRPPPHRPRTTPNIRQQAMPCDLLCKFRPRGPLSSPRRDKEVIPNHRTHATFQTVAPVETGNSPGRHRGLRRIAK